jgi:nucleoid DNA-binding protein
VIKADLVRKIAAGFSLSGAVSERIVQTLLEEIVTGVVSEGNVELRRFGVFTVRQQAPRVITLPTGKKIKRPAQKIVTFAASPTVKKKLNPPPARKPRTARP